MNRTDTTAIDAATTKSAAKEKPQTKSSRVETMLARKAGARIDEMCEATGWQPHTCRAFMTSLRKKGREVTREKNSRGKNIYKMAKPNNAQRCK